MKGLKVHKVHRVQGPEDQQGESGIPCSVEDNGDGTFTMTCEGYNPVTFGETDEPTGGHLLYPNFGQKSGGDTWRCKECHGWDYIGKDGRYSSGSNYTGIRGFFPASISLWRALLNYQNAILPIR